MSGIRKVENYSFYLVTDLLIATCEPYTTGERIYLCNSLSQCQRTCYPVLSIDCATNASYLKLPSVEVGNLAATPYSHYTMQIQPPPLPPPPPCRPYMYSRYTMSIQPPPPPPSPTAQVTKHAFSIYMCHCFRKKDHHHHQHTVHITIILCQSSTSITTIATTTTTTTTAQDAMHAFRICDTALGKRPPPSHSASYNIASNHHYHHHPTTTMN